MSAIFRSAGVAGAAFILTLGLGACSNSGSGNGISIAPPTAGGSTATTCQEQFNPDQAAAGADCTPVYNTYCPDATGVLPSVTAPVGACDGVTVTSGTATTADGLSSDYVVLTPSTGGGNALYLALHWADATGPAMVNYMRLSELAKARNITVVAPTAPGNPLNPAGGRTWGESSLIVPGTTVAQRVALLNAVISQVKNGAKAGQPLLIAGSSGGGAMAFEYLCDAAHQFDVSGILIVAGEVTPSKTAACNLSAPVATVQVHGTTDWVAPYADAQAAYAFLSNHNGCTAAKTAHLPPASNDVLISDIKIDYAYPCAANKGSSLVTITGGGHNWPGENRNFDLPANLFGPVADGFDATLQGYDLLRYLGG